MGSTIWLKIDDNGEPSAAELDNSIMLRVEKDLDALNVGKAHQATAWTDVTRFGAKDEL